MKPRTVRLPDELDLLLQDEAEKTGTTEAEIIRRVLTDYYRIRPQENSIEALIRRIVGEVLSESTPKAPVSTSKSIHKTPPSTSEKKDTAPSRTLKAPSESTSKASESTPITKPTIQRLSEDSATQERIKEIWRTGERNRQNIARQVGYKDRTVQQYIKDCLESGELEK